MVAAPQIKSMLTQLEVGPTFVHVLCTTDANTMEVVQMVLCGRVNKNIVCAISAQAGPIMRGAFGLCGLDGCLIRARRISDDLRLVGQPVSVDSALLRDILALGLVPVIAPVGFEDCGDGQFTPLNINADTAVGTAATALDARAFLIMTDIAGVLDKDEEVIAELRSSALKGLREDGTVFDGIISKLETTAATVTAGAAEVSILDGRERHTLLRAVSGGKFGTRIRDDPGIVAWAAPPMKRNREVQCVRMNLYICMISF